MTKLNIVCICALGILTVSCDVDAQYRSLNRIDRMSETTLSDEILDEALFGNSESWKTIVDLRPAYEQTFSLSDQAISVVGRWLAVNFDESSGNYVFLPNRLFISEIYVRDEDDNLVTTSVGEWRVENGVILVVIHGYLLQDETWTRQDRQQRFTRIEPREYVIGRISYILDDGYTTRPFVAIDYQQYVEGNIVGDETSFEPMVMARTQYSEDIVNNHAIRYEYLNVVFAMEQRNITTQELLASDELVEATVSPIAWVIDRRLGALGF